jgi:hypothetical protein
VFDRYSLTLKGQTKKALRQVSAYTDAQDATPTVIPVHTAVHTTAVPGAEAAS